LQEALPAGPPGMADELVVAGGGNHWHWDWSDGELLASLPPLPEFPESNGIVRIDVRPILYICALHAHRARPLRPNTPCGGTSFAGHVLAFAVFLKPISFWQLFGIASNIMVNKDYDAEDLMGRDVLEFWSKMAECATFRQRIRAIEKYLLPFAARARVRDHEDG